MQFAKTSTPGYTLLNFHTYNLSINTYTSNFPTAIYFPSEKKNTLTTSLIFVVLQHESCFHVLCTI